MPNPSKPALKLPLRVWSPPYYDGDQVARDSDGLHVRLDELVSLANASANRAAEIERLRGRLMETRAELLVQLQCDRYHPVNEDDWEAATKAMIEPVAKGNERMIKPPDEQPKYRRESPAAAKFAREFGERVSRGLPPPSEVQSLTVESTDRKFLSRLIDWLNAQPVAEGSTVLRLHDGAVAESHWTTKLPDHEGWWLWYPTPEPRPFLKPTVRKVKRDQDGTLICETYPLASIGGLWSSSPIPEPAKDAV